VAKFRISAIKPITNENIVFWYDNMSSIIFNEDGSILPLVGEEKEYKSFPVQTSKDTPAGKSKDIKVLKIQLGLSCNYECSYCNQRFVPKADETTQNDVQPFLDKLPSWITPQEEFEVQFWGGEPLVYIKTLVPLAEGIKALYPNARLTMITNGSLLTKEINQWIDRMGFNIGLSHDGPGYHVRGQDPLDDPEQLENILDLWNILGPKSRMSFNCMIHKDNKSRAAVQEWFKDKLGFEPPIGEGGFIDPYDDGGVASSMQDPAEHINYRLQAFGEIRDGKIHSFDIERKKIEGFVKSILTKRPAGALGQKCGMDDPEKIAVDLKGNVLTCQNESAVATSFNGESHLIGHLDDFDNIKLKTSTHWSHREECPKCPVLQLCHGSCMFLAGPMWELACDNSYSDNIPFFMAAWEMLTGTIPFYIDGDIREDRKDIVGAVNGIPKAKKVISIQPV
jgi:uncharacterized protein